MALMANRSHARRAPWLDMLKTGGHSNGSTTSPAPTTKVVTQVVARKLRRSKVWPSEPWFPLQITTFELIPACGAKIPRTKMAYETHSLHYLHCQLNIHVIIPQSKGATGPNGHEQSHVNLLSEWSAGLTRSNTQCNAVHSCFAPA